MTDAKNEAASGASLSDAGLGATDYQKPKWYAARELEMEVAALEHEVADLRRKLAADDASLTEATAEILRLRKIEAAARNLVMQKGRHHTEQAYARLAALMVPNNPN